MDAVLGERVSLLEVDGDLARAVDAEDRETALASTAVRVFAIPRGPWRPAFEPIAAGAIGVLVVNQPTWSIKANVLAREVLRAYFASQNVPMVSPPSTQPSTTAGTKQRRQRGS